MGKSDGLNRIRALAFPARALLGLFAAGLTACATQPPLTDTYVMIRRGDSAVVNRAIDEVVKHWTPFMSLWEIAEPSKFVVTIDTTPRIAHGFVLAFDFDSLPPTLKCNGARYQHRLVAWIPSPDGVGVEAVWVAAPGQPRRAVADLKPPGPCPAMNGNTDSMAKLGTYRVIERVVQTPGYTGVQGTISLNAGAITFRDRPCKGKGMRQKLRNYRITCSDHWYTVNVDAGLVRADSLRWIRLASRHTLKVSTSLVVGKMLHVNCARPPSNILCPQY